MFGKKTSIATKSGMSQVCDETSEEDKDAVVDNELELLRTDRCTQ